MTTKAPPDLSCCQGLQQAQHAACRDNAGCGIGPCNEVR